VPEAIIETIIFSAPFASFVALVIGALLARWVTNKARDKVVRAILHAFVVTLEQMDFPGDYDDLLLEVIKKLKEKEFNTKKEEEAALDELNEMRYKHKQDKMA